MNRRSPYDQDNDGDDDYDNQQEDYQQDNYQQQGPDETQSDDDEEQQDQSEVAEDPSIRVTPSRTQSDPLPSQEAERDKVRNLHHRQTHFVLNPPCARRLMQITILKS